MSRRSRDFLRHILDETEYLIVIPILYEAALNKADVI